MKNRISMAIAFGLSAIFLVSCTRGASLPRPVPEDARNPIVFQVKGATPPEVIDAVTDAMASIAVPMVQLRRSEGYAESAWIDVANFVQTIRRTYPADELIVQYQIGVTEADRPGLRKVGIEAVYRPYPIDRARARDRPVPTDHPGYQLAMRIEEQLRLELIGMGVEILEVETEDSAPSDSAGSPP